MPGGREPASGLLDETKEVVGPMAPLVQVGQVDLPTL